MTEDYEPDCLASTFLPLSWLSCFTDHIFKPSSISHPVLSLFLLLFLFIPTLPFPQSSIQSRRGLSSAWLSNHRSQIQSDRSTQRKGKN